VGSGQPEHFAGFRAATGYDGPLFADPSLRTFTAAGLASGWTRTLHPLTLLKGLRAFANGFRQGARRGNPVQQGGTFVLGPGERVRFEWRDRFAGDHPEMRDVLAALDGSS
jgi:AhpC/TSA antioxidant enzyme